MKKIVIFPLVGIFCLNFIHLDTSVKYNQLKNLKSVNIFYDNNTEGILISPNATPTVLVTSVVFATVLSASVCFAIGGPPKPEDPKDPKKIDPKKREFNKRHSFIDKNLYLFNLD